MLKIMIVDDELYFREALKLSLPWNDLGFEICGEAKNGVDALDRLESLKPDIVLADINMPVMDGLEFAQSVKERGINTKIVILTGYSEFSYAKQAVQLGVQNYLLKPIDEEELSNTLIQIKSVIDRESKIKIEFDRLKLQAKESMPILKDKLLNELIQGNSILKADEVKRRMEYLKMNIISEYYQVATIEPDYEKTPEWNEDDKQLWKFAVLNITTEILDDFFPHELCCDNQDRICVIVGYGSNEKDAVELLTARLEQIIDVVWMHLKIPITIGVGSITTDIGNISISYKESLIALKNRLTIGSNKVILYSSISDSGLRGNLFTAEHRNQLLMNLRMMNKEAVDTFIGQVFDTIRFKGINPEHIFVICIEMVSVCLEFIAEMGQSFESVFSDSRLNIIDEIQCKKSLDEMESWVKGLFKHVISHVGKNRSSKASKIIEEVKSYIEKNYHRDSLGIDEMAMNLFVNYGHLCFVFKRETGITINEYLTEFRIKKAKQLIDEGNRLLLDVANRVGYADPNYFGKCFKKYYGLPPSKYIDSIS